MGLPVASTALGAAAALLLAVAPPAASWAPASSPDEGSSGAVGSALALPGSPAAGGPGVGLAGAGVPPEAGLPGLCALAPDPEPPAYYAFPLVTTRRVPGTGLARGTAAVTFAPSPFGIALAGDGSYRLDLSLAVNGLRGPASGVWTVWVTTPELDRIRRLGTLTPDGTASGRVEWNKFLVVLTLEPANDPEATSWSGPIVLRGMSRSGMMHTMAGHGPFEQENCAQYGYD